ncbi:MAG: glycosyltransferase family A protein [Caldilineaceae bacterium]
MNIQLSSMPAISVIIPVYNAEPFLAEAIESVLNQTVPPHQVIVVDDGSTDQSATIARRYCPHIQFEQQPNAGGAAARNRGVALAQGEFLAFLDNDDYWAPEKLTWQIDAFQRTPALEAVFGQLQQTHTVEKAGTDGARFAMNHQDGWHLDTILMRRQAFDRIGPFDPTWQVDTVEWLWRARRLGLHTMVLPQVLAWRRIHDNNLSIRARSHLHIEYLRLIRTVRAQQQSQVTSTSTVSNQLPYDTAAYAATLRHLGTPFAVHGWPGQLLRCAIPGATDMFDAVGPWPYCSPPEVSQLPALYHALQAQGLVTFRAFFRPEAAPATEQWQHAGFTPVLLKEHFVFDPALDWPPHSAKTRSNIRCGQRWWCVEEIALADHHRTIAAYHERLVSSRQFSAMAALPPAHFAALADLPNVHVLGALDKEGLGAALITVHEETSVHFHVIVGAERAYQRCAFYALYQAAIERWSPSHMIYLGGAPSSPNGPGIARFKRRFANRRMPVYMIQAVLDRERCQRLVSTLATSQVNWFPPYRGC